MDRNWNQFLTRYHTATIPSPVLPQCCPNCGAEIRWGWTAEEKIDEPVTQGDCCERQLGAWRCVRIECIPRPDQTVFCPSCEAQILN